MRQAGSKSGYTLNAHLAQGGPMYSKPTVAPPAAVLLQHLLDLGRAFDVRIIQISDMDVNQSIARRLVALDTQAVVARSILVPIVTDDRVYCAAMHELGHNLAPNGVIRTDPKDEDSGKKLVEEEAAWEWARHYAICWTPAMEQLATDSLASYRAGHLRDRVQRERAADPAREAKRVERLREWIKKL
jgi:hypothetical protein